VEVVYFEFVVFNLNHENVCVIVNTYLNLSSTKGKRKKKCKATPVTGHGYT
jgi:hypothetical protein